MEKVIKEKYDVVEIHGGGTIKGKTGSVSVGRRIKDNLHWYSGDNLKIYVLEDGTLLVENMTDPDVLAERSPETWAEKVAAARRQARELPPPDMARIQTEYRIAIAETVVDMGWEIGDNVAIRSEGENTISVKNVTAIPILKDRVAELKRKDALVAPRRGELVVKKKGDGAISTKAAGRMRRKSLADEKQRHQIAAEERQREKKDAEEQEAKVVKVDIADIGFRNIVSASHPRLMEFIETGVMPKMPNAMLQRLLKVGALTQREGIYSIADETMTILNEWEDVWKRNRDEKNVA